MRSGSTLLAGGSFADVYVRLLNQKQGLGSPGKAAVGTNCHVTFMARVAASSVSGLGHSAPSTPLSFGPCATALQAWKGGGGCRARLKFNGRSSSGCDMRRLGVQETRVQLCRVRCRSSDVAAPHSSAGQACTAAADQRNECDATHRRSRWKLSSSREKR